MSKNTLAHDNKRVIAGRNGGKLTPFNSDTAREAVKAREEKRIRLYNEGAKRAVLDSQLIREYGEDAHIVERGMTMQTIATTPDAGKAAVMAAQHLDRAQGLTVDKAQGDSPAVTLTVSGEGLQRLAAILGIGNDNYIDADTEVISVDDEARGGGGI